MREYLDTYEATHDYDEYHFDLDEIEHDPYVLISILSALHEGVFTIDQVQGDLQTLFDKQYILTETVTTETRYRTETRTDSEGNTYTVRVPYTWTICTVTLENFDLSHVPVYMMGEEQLSLYATYMSTLGNRPDLFPSSGYVNKYIDNPPTAWEIPAEYLTDERFNTPHYRGGKIPGLSLCMGRQQSQHFFRLQRIRQLCADQQRPVQYRAVGRPGALQHFHPGIRPPARRIWCSSWGPMIPAACPMWAFM